MTSEMDQIFAKGMLNDWFDHLKLNCYIESLVQSSLIELSYLGIDLIIFNWIKRFSYWLNHLKLNCYIEFVSLIHFELNYTP